MADIKSARKTLKIVTVQNRYNLVDRKSQDVLEYCEANKIGFIPWFPIASGELARPGGPLDRIQHATGATPAQIALAWLLRRSPVMLPIPGTASVKHLEENCAAASVELTDQQFDELASMQI